MLAWIFDECRKVFDSEKKENKEVLHMAEQRSMEQIQEAFQEFMRRGERATNEAADEYWFKTQEIKDVAEIVRLLAKGMQEGSALCARVLGERYMSGDGVAKDLDQAEKCLRMASECGIPGAMCFLGNNIYYDKDRDLALDWMCKAAIKGDISVFYALSNRMEQDPEVKGQIEARLSPYFQEYCDKEERSGREDMFLGWCYMLSLCCKENVMFSVRLWVEGHRKGDLNCSALLRMNEIEASDNYEPLSSGELCVFNVQIPERGQSQEEEEKEGNEVEVQGTSKEEGGGSLKAILSIVIGLFSIGQMQGLSLVGLILGIWAMKGKPGVLSVIGIVVNVISLLGLAGIL